MSPSQRYLWAILGAALVAVAAVHATDRPKLPRGEELAERDAEDFQLRMARQGRSPFWPLRHPALDARKRHRAPEFQHPNVRFVNTHYFGDVGGPYAGDDSWEDARPQLDNRIRDRHMDRAKPMTAEELIQALQEKQWGVKTFQDEEGPTPQAMAFRFGGVGRKK